LESTSLTIRPSIAIRPAADLLEAGEHPEERRLAAARGTDQHHELAVGDVEGNSVEDGGFFEIFPDFTEGTEAISS